MTLRELCRRAEVDPSLLSKILSGKRAPPASERVLRRLAGALEISPIELVVSAGLLPEEWSRLKEDSALLESVGRAIEAPLPRGPRRLPERSEGLEAELL